MWKSLPCICVLICLCFNAPHPLVWSSQPPSRHLDLWLIFQQRNYSLLVHVFPDVFWLCGCSSFLWRTAGPCWRCQTWFISTHQRQLSRTWNKVSFCHTWPWSGAEADLFKIPVQSDIKTLFNMTNHVVLNCSAQAALFKSKENTSWIQNCSFTEKFTLMHLCHSVPGYYI